MPRLETFVEASMRQEIAAPALAVEGSVISRIVLIFYCATLLLLPWGWFPHFPFIPKPAQWSDAVFATTVVAWLIERWRAGKWPRLSGVHIALACYFVAATLS